MDPRLRGVTNGGRARPGRVNGRTGHTAKRDVWQKSIKRLMLTGLTWIEAISHFFS